MKKILSVLLAVAMLFALASCGSNSGSSSASGSASGSSNLSDLKVGFIFLHDENSTYDKNFIDAAKEAQKELGLKDDQVLFKTNIPESNECYEAAAALVDAGCKLVFADSFGHEPYMLQAAKEFTDVQFCHATGTNAHTEKLANFHNAFASIYEGRYLAGIAAGVKIKDAIDNGKTINGVKVTADNAKVGYVGAFPYAEVISGYTSFFLGIRSVVPTATMEVQYTNSWYDEGKEKEAAEALIGKKCILISQHADSMGAPTACEKANVPNVSYNGSTISACPNTFIVSSRISWTPYFKHIINAVANGTAITEDYCGGIKEGSVVLTDINEKAAAAGTQEAIDAAKAQLEAGTLHVFDTSKFTVDGKTLTTYKADVDTDENYTPDTEAIADGYFHESEYRSAPYFNIIIDGITVPAAN